MKFWEAMAITAGRDETTIILRKDGNPDHELWLWRGDPERPDFLEWFAGAELTSANARGVTVDSICTIATRDSHHHRVSCPCAKYHRVLTRHRVALRFREDFAT